MTRSKKRNLIILITLILTFIAVLGIYWGLIGFNPLIWIQNNANIFILGAVLGGCALLIIIGYALQHRNKL